jgi:hypothetical protein
LEISYPDNPSRYPFFRRCGFLPRTVRNIHQSANAARSTMVQHAPTPLGPAQAGVFVLAPCGGSVMLAVEGDR